jgi:hypothetical protein
VTRALAITPEQEREAVELRTAGMSWKTIGARLGCSYSAARKLVLRLSGGQLPPVSPARSGRPPKRRRAPDRRIMRPGGGAGRPKGTADSCRSISLYTISLARAWISRGWTVRRVARILEECEGTIRRWCL